MKIGNYNYNRLEYFDNNLIPIAKIVSDWGYSVDYVTVALLHDDLKNPSKPNYDGLKTMFGEEVADAIKILSSEKDLTFNCMIKIKENPIAKIVMRAKLAHEIELAKKNMITENDKCLMLEKKKFFDFLGESDGTI